MTTAPPEQQLEITPASDDEIDLRKLPELSAAAGPGLRVVGP